MTERSDPSSPTSGVDPVLRDQAQHWIARLAGGDIDEARLSELEAWLAADPRHAQAFSRERALWQDLADVLAEPDAEPAGPSNVVALHAAPSRRRRLIRYAPAAIAAGLAAFFLLPSLIMGLRADYRTGIGEIRTIGLPDGTTAMLDGDSAIAVDYAGGQRLVRLLAGRAWFDVHHEDRPFVVAALGGATRDIGTGFEVRRDGDSVEVGVTQGAVRVEAPDGATTPPLHAGQRIRYSASGLAPLAPGPVSRMAAWRNREILLDDEPVETAIAEIARYRSAPVWTFGDFGGVAPVSGLFLIERPDEAVHILARMRGLRVTTLPGGFLVVRPAAR